MKTKACSNAEYWQKASTALEKFQNDECYSLREKQQILHSAKFDLIQQAWHNAVIQGVLDILVHIAL